MRCAAAALLAIALAACEADPEEDQPASDGASNWDAADGRGADAADGALELGPEAAVQAARDGGTDAPMDGREGDGRVPASDAVEVAAETAPALACAAEDPVVRLPYRASFSAYSRAREKLLIVDAAQRVLHLLDVEACTDVELPLPAAALSLAVSPDGLTAAVGHDAKITAVDVAAERVIGSYVVSATASNLQVDDRRRAHLFDPRRDFETSSLLTVDLATGAIATGVAVRGSFKMRLHPKGDRLYQYDAREIARLDVAGPSAKYLDPGQRRDVELCGRLFFSDDGARLFTGCRTVLRSAAASDQDLSYDGTLEGIDAVLDVDSLAAAGIIALIPGPTASYDSTPFDRRLRIHEGRYLNLTREIPLPSLPGTAGNEPAHGRRVFIRGDGARIYVVLARATYDFDNDRHAILRIKP
jgi:chitinase